MGPRALLAVATVIAGCTDASGPEVFTLYRNVPSDQGFRVHVATFDATGHDGRASDFYNLSNMNNCERARDMFQALPDWKGVKFWCEKGRFKK